MSESTLGRILVGRYRLEETIGRGGMSTVYRAFDTVLERPVAIKLMHREIASDSGQLERFRREARAVAGLSHPHVVTVIDAGEDESMDVHGAGPGNGEEIVARPFIVFELVEGETLKQLIARAGPLEIPQAIAYAVEIARALGAAHAHMLVHRDVKPQNILIDPEGRAKITDFGIARTLSEEGLTLAGRVLGTTDYVSPEQALGRPVSGQSDIYSLGVVLFEMLTGSVPFSGGTPVTIAMRHVREELPDVQALRGEVSAATAAVIDRATAKELGDRYPDMASLATDLEEVLAIETTRTGQATGAVPRVLSTLPGAIRRRVPWRIRHPLRSLASLAILAVVVAITLILLAHHTHRGTGIPPGVVSTPGLAPVPLGQTSARSYNPFGTGPENRDQEGFVVDSDPATSWSTEEYFEHNLHKAGGTGTGLYVDAAPGVAAKQIEIQTTTPGFAVKVYVADAFTQLPSGNPTSLLRRGWVGPVGSDSDVSARARIPLHVNRRLYRYYLVWITTLPPKSDLASISELTLFK